VKSVPADRYQCQRCDVICRERSTGAEGSLVADDFRSQAEAGLPLALLELSGAAVRYPPLPILIPLRTDELPPGVEVTIPCVGVDARALFSRHRNGPVRARPEFLRPDRARQQLRVGSGTRIVGILNGNDATMEGFWGMPRMPFLEQAKIAGFELFTGPTFSVTSESGEIPASHNVIRLLHHHRVVQEIAVVGIAAAPNIYWRRKRDRDEWVEWLRRNPQVSMISRDFSRTKSRELFLPELSGLIKILRAIDRPMHVLLVGVGGAKAGVTLRHLAEVQATASIATASPVIAARRGMALRTAAGGRLRRVRDQRHGWEHIAINNIRAVQDLLNSVAIDLPGYAAS
jgi:hypothetical protein